MIEAGSDKTIESRKNEFSKPARSGVLNRSKSSVFRIVLVVGSTLVALLFVAVACRFVLPQQTSIRFQQDVDELEDLDLDEAAGMIENDPELFWRLAPNMELPDDSWPFFGIISNGQSLREEDEIPLKNPSGEKRILFLGDSCTFGYGVDQDQTFVEVAESMFQRQLGFPVECINAGVPGYSVFQGYRFLATRGLDFEPDLVVVTFGWNDSGVWDHLGDREHHEILEAMRPPGVLAKSRLCQTVWRVLNQPDPGQAEGEERPRMTPEEFTRTLEEMQSLLDEREIPMLILVWPMRANTEPEVPPTARTPLQMEMTHFVRPHSISSEPKVEGLLDLVPLAQDLVRKKGVRSIYLDHGHVTPVAHEAIAERVVKHLLPWLKK